MPINNCEDAHKARAAIKAQIASGTVTRYAIAKKAGIDRATLRNILDRQEDMQLSNFLAIVQAMGGTVSIGWE